MIGVEQIFYPMDARLLIEIVTAGATALGSSAAVFVIMRKHSKETEQRNNEKLKAEITKDCGLHHIEIINFRKEVDEMKKKHEIEIKETRREFLNSLDKIEQNNREDHQLMFAKIDVLKDLIIKQKIA